MLTSLIQKFWNEFVRDNDIKRMAEIPYEKGLYERTNIPYVDDGHPYHLADVYAPDKGGVYPTLVDIHGGGWYYGDKDLNKAYCLSMAKRGFRVINLSYRLTPEVDLGGQVKDIFEALNFFTAHAEEYNIDTDNMFITGDSAGGHLAGVVTNIIANPEQALAYGVNPTCTFRAGIYTCGMHSISKIYRIPLAHAYFKPLLGRLSKAPYAKYVDFAPSIGSNRIPALFITCDGDFLKPFVLKAYKAYKATGATAELCYYPREKQSNKLTHVFNVIQPGWRESIEANDITCAFCFDNMKK